MKGFPDSFAIIDTETTGMRPGFDRVMDIGIIRVENGKVVERYESLIDPAQTVPDFITSMTGIHSDDLAAAPPFDEIALEVERLLKGAVFVAHNASFDYGFVKSEFARIGMEWSAETLCTVRLSRALFPKEKSHSLDSIIDRHGITCSSRHRALPDADAVLQFMQKISFTVSSGVIKRAIKALRRGSFPALGKDSFSDLPDSAGVYKFYGPEQELLYIGKSKRIRTRARSHFNPGATGADLRYKNDVTSIDVIKTSGELSALILESALVKSESPIYNRMLRRRKVLVIAKAERDEAGYDRLVLEKCGDIKPDGSVLAVFRTMTQGKSVLHRMAKTNRLCEKMLGIESTKGECFASQLGACDGACIGKISSREHNIRIKEAFKRRKIISWPYGGPIVVKEVENATRGTVFFLDNWALVGAYRYDNDVYESLLQGSYEFDYDSYKILARYLRKKENKRYVQTLSRDELSTMLAECSGNYEMVVS